MGSSTPVAYERTGEVATITMDDGRANALSPTMQAHINEALDAAEGDSVKAIVLAGNHKLFCAGFDLSVIKAGERSAILSMLTGGFELAARLLTFPKPVVVAAAGPAIAMGSFLLLAGDCRVGSPRTRCQANEVAIGMSLPTSAIEIMRMRLTPSAFQRGATMAAAYAEEAAVSAGWLDEIVEDGEVLARAQFVAAEAAATLDLRAHAETKLKARFAGVTAIRDGFDRIDEEFFGR
ncbi:crotonase/enoyl-CoA hydratase family protein [Mycobacterium sp. CBMA293]|uniref:crotonase/enoyl-CoA hydratase family protein n=1 Tax=unclassified Mycolicibacterium TaxID=2636767 RepID=UPI0012DEAC47|nr:MULTISPECIES: crotonase/enoyl-CoA hydratase family protein [unclassified Mycolicibacterium]MUL46286.1 crotonase/enoyl-CoA hydratase family protein [Mycolicibacterium sp. CBMA 360]MUL57203.1 crotonase/enoyl-CoA hydratase family protein [Mycolicibacterium sp. CBMA 335]MUL70243.1 crotonase/enoyl-CoA hydratase family protein [Mycolicibacterium sp. CBMA 311]MUL92291.1 crotonase/enoyl-CoA hydratase family protein [Mycolicibacterium sp. CBMA 230]MUM04777.1 enoyl-CoA hydratase [Mycolicibacterium sp